MRRVIPVVSVICFTYSQHAISSPFGNTFDLRYNTIDKRSMTKRLEISRLFPHGYSHYTITLPLNTIEMPYEPAVHSSIHSLVHHDRNFLRNDITTDSERICFRNKPICSSSSIPYSGCLIAAAMRHCQSQKCRWRIRRGPGRRGAMRQGQ
jgi:hypothetical protein